MPVGEEIRQYDRTNQEEQDSVTSINGFHVQNNPTEFQKSSRKTKKEKAHTPSPLTPP
jgi:hypothetical protein